eukprot:TRINITY_DN9069_c0_g1_i4.p2 TRINITY_DN9069_c0_g1~~TRINITY_DN9069_c0_g1_i4.p2  ORF type:complete len:203 (-),score=35.23 TRINITY_DN9069_c0_g1_i4:1644-2252(-)
MTPSAPHPAMGWSNALRSLGGEFPQKLSEQEFHAWAEHIVVLPVVIGVVGIIVALLTMFGSWCCGCVREDTSRGAKKPSSAPLIGISACCFAIILFTCKQFTGPLSAGAYEMGEAIGGFAKNVLHLHDDGKNAETSIGNTIEQLESFKSLCHNKVGWTIVASQLGPARQDLDKAQLNVQQFVNFTTQAVNFFEKLQLEEEIP